VPTITAVSGQEGGTNGNSVTSLSRAFSSDITSGNIVIILGAKVTPTSEQWDANDCTKTGGTATIGTIVALASYELSTPLTGGFGSVAVWAAPVTGSGSCTMQIGNAPAGTFMLIGMGEYSTAGTWAMLPLLEGWRVNGSAAAGDPTATAGPATSVDSAVFFGALQVQSTTGGSITEDAAFTVIYENESATDDNGSFIRRIVSSGTTDTAEWSMAAADQGWVAALALVKDQGIPTAREMWWRA